MRGLRREWALAVDEPDCARDRGSGTAEVGAASLRFVGERSGQQGGAGAGEHEWHDRLARGGLDRDLGGDADGGERLLEQHPG